MPTPEAFLLSDYAKELKHWLVEARDADDDFERGRRMGLFEALSHLLSQIEAFGLSAEELGVAAIEPMSLLLAAPGSTQQKGRRRRRPSRSAP